jgi:LysR family transcriptional regulator, cys regulon transcriptional activator
MSMTLTQLRYLVAVVDSQLNISHAARRVHTTQSAISKQIQLMEERLGLQLFSRKGKSLDHLTEVGVEVVRRARVILAEAGNIRALAANRLNQDSGELRIACTHTQARFVLPGAVAWLRRAYPDVAVHLLPSDEESLLESIGRGDVDLSIVSSVDMPRAGVAIPAFHWKRVLLVPRGHPLATLRRPLKIADLAAHPLVTYESALKSESTLRQAFAREGYTPDLACIARDADLIKTYVRAGLGAGVLAEMAVLPEDVRDLKLIPIDDLLPRCTTWLVLRRDQVLCHFAMRFITHLAPHIDARDVNLALAGETVIHASPPTWGELMAVPRIA